MKILMRETKEQMERGWERGKEGDREKGWMKREEEIKRGDSSGLVDCEIEGNDEKMKTEHHHWSPYYIICSSLQGLIILIFSPFPLFSQFLSSTPFLCSSLPLLLKAIKPIRSDIMMGVEREVEWWGEDREVWRANVLQFALSFPTTFTFIMIFHHITPWWYSHHNLQP